MRPVRLVWSVLGSVLGSALGAVGVLGGAESAATDTGTVEAVVDGWSAGPVYVDPGSSAFLPPDGAAELRDRVDGHEPPTFIAAVPARVLTAATGGSDAERARTFLDAVVDENDSDGVYIVSFAGAGTYGSAVGVDLPVGPVLEERLGEFALSEPVPMLHAVLDDLDVPGSPESGAGWVLPVVVIVAVLAAGAGAFLLVRRRRRAADSSEAAVGPAQYRPSFDVLPDEADDLSERQALAREDVTRFGEELDAADVPLEGPETAADVQAAMDAYTEAGRVADADPDDAGLRSMRETVEYGRWRLARARARLGGAPEPPRRDPCFIDPAHGVSVADWRYRPANGITRDVPVCAGCLDRMKESAR